MSLFQTKVIAKEIGSHPDPIPQEHLTLLQSWKDSIEEGILAKQKEVAVHSPFTQNIMVGVLGYQTVGHGDQWSISREYGVASGAVDLALGHFTADKDSDVVTAPFELKGAKTKDLDAIMSGRHKTPVQQAWDYARDIKGAQWVLVSNYLEIRLYAVSETSLVYEQFDLTKLTDPWEYARFMLLLHADNFLSGQTLRFLEQSQQADKDITVKLYEDYKALRSTLITSLIKDNPEHEPLVLISLAQKLLDRILFVAFAEDKGLIPEQTVKQAFEHADPYNPKPIYDNFKGLFRSIDVGNKALNIPAYNGGLFAEDTQLDNLNVSDELCQSFNELADYDFDSEVSVTVLGHIFEQSIADLEAIILQVEEGQLPASFKKARAVSGKRKKQGVVYTPDHITRFIVEHTLGHHIQDRFDDLLEGYGSIKKDGSIRWKKASKIELRFWYAWQEALKEIKVVDPACGSGAFLVAAFDYLHAEYQRVNSKLAELTGQLSVLDLNKEILNNNLYGVDINDESIEISKLSLWLKTAERGKPLTSLDTNLISGNSLGFASQAPESNFCWQTAFPHILNNGGFDVVLGNPPYVRQELFSNLKPWLKQHYQVYHGVVDLYAYFFELGHKLLKPNGRMGYISSSTFFKTGSGEPLRRYLMEQTALEKVVDFGDVQVFEGVTTYPVILVFQKSEPTQEHKFNILVLHDKLPFNLSQHFSQHQGHMVQTQLTYESWQLEDEVLSQLRQKLTLGHNTLKEIYGSPYRGLLTGLNVAFIIDRATRDRLIKEDAKSAELLKPFLEGKDLKKWHSQSSDMWLIAIPKLWTRQNMGKNEREAITEHEAWEWFKNEQNAISAWLSPFAEKARRRTDKGEFWWELRACAYYDKFDNNKIFYPDLSQGAKFHYDNTGSFAVNTIYFYPDANWYLLGILNSPPIWFFLRGISDAMRGGTWRLRLFTQNMDRIPVPNTSPEQKKKISDLAKEIQSLIEQRYSIESNFSRRLPDLCPPDQEPKLNKKLQSWWELDFTDLQKAIKTSFKITIPLAERNDWQDYFEIEQGKIKDLNLEINQLESELNQAVYELFGLTQAEVDLIEDYS